MAVSAYSADELRSHLVMMMSKEKLSGDFLLASVVQDSLIYNLHHHADSETLLELAHLAAQVAVEAAATQMSNNIFAVKESVRGTMHSMVTLGGEPVLVAMAIATGGLEGIRNSVPAEDASQYAAALVSGVATAVQDLGLNDTHIVKAAEHIADHSGPSSTNLGSLAN